MADELVDIVNEQDEVTGKLMKSQAHAQGLIHRLSVVYVFYKGKLLIQKRSPHKNGLLDHSVGGHVGEDESYETAAVREMKEEIGVDAPVSFVGKAYEDVTDPIHGFHFRHHFGIFETQLTDAQFATLKHDAYEADAMIPMTLEELVEAMNARNKEFTAGILYTFNEYIKNKKLPFTPVPVYRVM